MKPVTDLHAQRRRRARGVLHVVGRALPDPLGIAVAPHVGRQDRLVALVDRVAYRLARRGGCRSPSTTGRGARGSRGGRRSSRSRSAPRPRRSGRPSTPARGRRSPRPPHFSASSSSVRSAHWPVNRVTGRVMLPPSSDTVSRWTPAARYVLATSGGRSASVMIRSGSSAPMIVSSDARPNLLASISATVRCAPERAALITSASGRREVVSPSSRVMPAAETNATSKLSCARNSTVQRPASILMCWSSSPGANDHVHRLGLHLERDRRRARDERELVRRVLHQPAREAQRGRGGVQEDRRPGHRRAVRRAPRSPPWPRGPARRAATTPSRSAAPRPGRAER